MPYFSIGPLVFQGIMTLDRNYNRISTVTNIVGGMANYSLFGMEGTQLQFDGLILGYGAVTKGIQLEELVQNPYARLQYITFPANEVSNDGWYYIESMEGPRQVWHRATYYQFKLKARRVGTADDVRQAIYWTSAQETVTGTGASWTSPVVDTLIGVGQNVSLVDQTVGGGTRGTSEGLVYIAENPTRPTIMYTPSSQMADWYKSTCKVFDTVTPGNLVESQWIQVFNSNHIFSGDTVIQNGILRYWIQSIPSFSSTSPLTPVVYVWDFLTSGTWQSIGFFTTYDSSVNYLGIVGLDFTYISNHEVRWRELRQGGGAASTSVFSLQNSLRMGADWFRVALDTATIASTNTFVQLRSTSGGTWYTNLFNGANTSVNANVAPDPASTYAGAYDIGRNFMYYWLYTTQPTQQPYFSGAASVFSESNNNNVVGATTIFGFGGYPVATNPITIAAARSLCALFAAEFLGRVQEELVLIPQGYWPGT